jgi:hypothetical protein
MNLVIVRGHLSSPPRRSELASGDTLVRLEVTVHHAEAPAESVPVCWVGPARRAPAGSLGAGDEVVAVGRVRRRWYRPPGGPARSATEVVADVVVRASDRRRARLAVERAIAGIETAEVVRV